MDRARLGDPKRRTMERARLGGPKRRAVERARLGDPKKSSGQRLTGRITDQKMHGPWEKEEQEELVEENNISKIDRIETGSFARLLQENDVPAEPCKP